MVSAFIIPLDMHGVSTASLTFLSLVSFSGEYTSTRGSGRGRGSRGRRRAAAADMSSFNNSDYLYYMNEAGARGGAFLSTTTTSSSAAAASAILSNGGSPSRLSVSSAGEGGYMSPTGATSSAGGAFDPFADQEELLFTEQYPGKLCSLCNLSERSALGQGDMVKYKVPADFDLSAEVKKRRNEVMLAAGTSDTQNNGDGSSVESSPRHGASAGSTSGSAGSSAAAAAAASLNARRKGRKLTSGDLGEPVDELDNVGFIEEPDHTLLFETSGKFTHSFLIL
jgi:hypothetical protein